MVYTRDMFVGLVEEVNAPRYSNVWKFEGKWIRELLYMAEAEGTSAVGSCQGRPIQLL